MVRRAVMVCCLCANEHGVGSVREKIPRSFVIKKGTANKYIRGLVKDMRTVMEPHTAAQLSVRVSGGKGDRRGEGIRAYGRVMWRSLGRIAQRRESEIERQRGSRTDL